MKIERSASTKQSSSARIDGRSLSIQDNNVHANKGRNVASPTKQPIISYKKMLKKEPQQINSESGEDNTICERCSHILAKCFSKTKKEDDHKPPKEGEPKSIPKPIENNRPDPSSNPQVHSIQSRLSPQHEQPKMARSRHDSQYEQPKMARSRHDSQYE